MKKNMIIRNRTTKEVVLGNILKEIVTLNALRLSKTNKNKEKPTKTGSLTKQIKTCFSLSLLVFIGF